jgi:hypothetical protein
MARYGVVDVIGTANMYPTLPTAVEAYRRWAEAHPEAVVTGVEPSISASSGHRFGVGELRRFARSLNPHRAGSGQGRAR